MTYNKKSIGPVIYFLAWLIVFAVICVLGISNVFASTYDSTTFTAQLYDNYGPSLHSVTTEFSNMSWRGTIPGMTANTSGAAWGVSSPIPLLANHTYSMTVKIEGPYGGNVVLSTYNRIGVGTSLSAAKTSYENNTNTTLNYSNAISSNMTLQFAFTPSISSNYIVFPFATNYTGDNQSFYLYNLVIDDLGSGGVNQTEINNSLNNQTNEINNSITNSENNIKGAIKDTEDNIKDGIKDGFESCRDSYNLIKPSYYSKTYNGLTLTFVDNGFNLTGTGIDMYGYFTISKITLSSGTYTINGVDGSSGSTYQLVIYDNTNKKTLSYVQKNSVSFTITDTINVELRFYPYQTTYDNKLFQYQLEKGTTVHDYEKYGEKVCKNRLDEANETSKGILGKIKDILSYINPFSENFFAYKLVELIINGLKSLFIPSDDFFSNWWNDFKSFMEAKLGFLTKPIDIFITFISSYLNLSEDNIIINIPNITVPNFEDNILIHAQTFNWKELLQSKTSFNNLWQLYLDFVDVFLIFNFIGLCEGVYARIFGGDTSNYEYYTVEDSYYFDSSTGEVAETGKHSERTVTKRKKV